MSGQVLVLAAFLALGAACQAAGARDGLRGAVWRVHFWSVSPLLVFGSALPAVAVVAIAFAVVH